MNILVIDDEKLLADTLVEELNRHGHRVRAAYDGADALAVLDHEHFDLILTDLFLPGLSGLELLPHFLSKAPGVSVIMMSGYGRTPDAVSAIKRGAEDYLQKPLDLEELTLLLERLQRRRQGEEDLLALKKTMATAASEEMKIYMGQGMSNVYEDLELVSGKETVNVLVVGETGTGKEHVATMLHRLSPRCAKPFVEVNCAAIPESLVEAELFGHEAGAFTDAKKQKLGLFEMAQGSTLFLDEIGDLPLAAQAKLLKVLEQRELRRVGGIVDIPLDVRVVAASNKDLHAEVMAGRFRADLYYRLNVFTVKLPALRERSKDIPALAQFFFERSCKELRRDLSPLTEAQLNDLASGPWPGNVRELRNVIEGAVIRARHEHADLSGLLLNRVPLLVASPEFPPMKQAVDKAVRAVKRELLERAIRQTSGNKLQAAKLLQVDNKTIYTLMKEFDMSAELDVMP